ncbi:MAG: NAD-dependent epimerase/dehydratase family protein [Actinomycetota bacterium]|nr:NAD-dependent epimerase/dehydratase family protein [Actinomycetota bacterium]
MGRTVLVTGVSRYLGGRMAALLAADPEVATVIGVDVVAPEREIPGTSFVRADIRNPVIAKVMGESGVDTVVHMGVIATPKQAGGRSTMKEINVIGTMQLLAACQRTPSVRSLVVKSTASVYGSGPKDPAKFTEDMEPKHAPSHGWAKDSVEVETYVRGFARRRPDVSVTTLRFANVIGPRVQTAITGYFSLPVIPTVLGFDPRLQFVHEDDLLESIRTAVRTARRGTFNVAGDGVLLLSQAVRRTGRRWIIVPRLMFSTVGRSLGPAGLADFSPEAVRYLTYGRGLDTTAMRTVLGFEPAWTSDAAFMSFVGRSEARVSVDVA